VVRRRSRRARRQAVEGLDSFEQNQRFRNSDANALQDRSIPLRRKHMLTPLERDHWLYTRHRPRYHSTATDDSWRQEPFDRNRPGMHQKHGEREQRYGGRRLSCGGWNGGFGAVRDTAIVAGSDVVVYDRHV
jgi:hypothetical protein